MAPGRLAALTACALALQLLAAPSAVRAVPRVTVAADFAGADLAAAARDVASGGRLTISGLALEGEAQPATLELQRRDVWAPGSKVVVHTASGEAQELAPPASHFFHGVIAGQPHSTVALSVQEDGSMTGIASAGESSYVLGVESGEASGGSGQRRSLLTARRAELEAPQRRGRRCGNKGSTLPPGRNHTWQEFADSSRRLQVGRLVGGRAPATWTSLAAQHAVQPPEPCLRMCMHCCHACQCACCAASAPQAATVLDQQLQATLAIDT